MVGRTLLQQALPITFGLKAAIWLSALTGARAELALVREQVLAVQLGGAVGTLAALGDRGLDVVATVAEELELADPQLPWHTVRLRPARLAGALGEALGAMGKIAQDLVLLAQIEVGESAEEPRPGRGGSSTMPHKRNPVGAIAVRACAQRAPGLVSTILASMVQEHERAAGAWQGEWAPLLELLSLAGSAATSLKETLAMLEVDGDRMSSNIDPLVMAESVVAALGGGNAAQTLVAGAAQRSLAEGRPLRDVLVDSPDVRERLRPDELERALDPQHYLGVAEELIDRALAAHDAVPEG
jgi:3-carboxy-cis,cis-muconate cycloisomerase